jgi:hypothetical protein
LVFFPCIVNYRTPPQSSGLDCLIGTFTQLAPGSGNG